MSDPDDITSNLRNKARIDYKALNESGQVLLKPSKLNSIHSSKSTDMESDETTCKQTNLSLSNTSADESVNMIEMPNKPNENTNVNKTNQQETVLLTELKSKYDILKEEIDDFIDENPTNYSVVSVDDIDLCIDKITELRSQFRQTVKNIEISMKKEQFASVFTTEISSMYAYMKEYIINAKDRKAEIRRQEKEICDSSSSIKLKREIEENSQRKRATDFLINEVTRISNELLSEFEKECDGQVTDDEILRRKEDLPANLLKMEQLSTKFQKCLETIPDDYEEKDENIESMTTQYNELVLHKESYEKFVKNEIREREISKERSFQIATLNINLTKFSGYESEMDIYTFQYEFDKLHLRTTPKKMLSDLLKYNYLDEPALSLVKSLDNIDEMWSRLKKAYGDAKTLLSKKLSSIQSIGPLWKIKDIERLKTALMALINGMSDLMSLAKYHNIEAKLYFGDGIDIIYGLMGDFRVTKWLTNTCDMDLDGEELWKELICFLEKELKVKQELSIIKKKYASNEKNDKVQNSYAVSTNSNEDETNQDLQNSAHVADRNQTSGMSKCAFCDETGHFERLDRHGNKIVDYFSCQKLIQMTPIDRFKELRRKGYCYMCLYPGALHHTGKHATGSCQIDFVCKHSSHDAYKKKKHVLVSHEHQTDEENKQTLECYKDRFILNRPNIPEFSKNIKLSFMTKQAFISKSKETKQ